MKEYGKLQDGKLVKVVVSEECPEGFKELVRDAIIPVDSEIIYIETEETIRQTYKQA